MLRDTITLEDTNSGKEVVLYYDEILPCIVSPAAVRNTYRMAGVPKDLSTVCRSKYLVRAIMTTSKMTGLHRLMNNANKRK